MKKLSLILVFMLCVSCSDQTRDEAEENLIGSWGQKGQNRVLIFLDTMPNQTYIDSPVSPTSADQTTVGMWMLQNRDGMFLLSMGSDTEMTVHWVQKIGKKKMVLQHSPYHSFDADLIFKKFKEKE